MLYTLQLRTFNPKADTNSHYEIGALLLAYPSSTLMESVSMRFRDVNALNKCNNDSTLPHHSNYYAGRGKKYSILAIRRMNSGGNNLHRQAPSGLFRTLLPGLFLTTHPHPHNPPSFFLCPPQFPMLGPPRCTLPYRSDLSV